MRWQTAQWFERRWWRNYLKDKPVHQYLSWKKDYWRGFLESIDLEVGPACSALDLGCGPAGIFTILNCKPLHALDPLILRYESELDHFSRSMYPHVHFIPSPLEQLVQENTYDFVFCLNAINHVDDLSLAFERIEQSCAQNGIAVISIDAHNFSFFKRLFRIFPGDILHPHQHDLDDYMGMTTSVGMTVERTVRLKSGFLFDYHVIIARKA